MEIQRKIRQQSPSKVQWLPATGCRLVLIDKRSSIFADLSLLVCVGGRPPPPPPSYALALFYMVKMVITRPRTIHTDTGTDTLQRERERERESLELL